MLTASGTGYQPPAREKREGIFGAVGGSGGTVRELSIRAAVGRCEVVGVYYL